MAAKNNVISTPFAMWGVSIIFIGLFLYLCGVFIASINKIIISDAIFHLSQNLVWYSGIPIVVGFILILHSPPLFTSVGNNMCTYYYFIIIYNIELLQINYYTFKN